MIDLHTHVVPPDTPFLDRFDDPRWARLDPGTGAVTVAGRQFRRVRRVAWDLDARRAEATAAGITGQLLSAMPELFAPWAPARAALDYARAFNAWLAEEVADHDGFFTGLGVVPVGDADAATALLADVQAQGLLGVEVPSLPPPGPWHDPVWDGFLGELAARGLLLFLHAVGTPTPYPHPLAANGVVFPASIGQAVAGLIASGTCARHPELRILASHGGGSVLSSLPRLEFLRAATPALQELMPEPPAVYARRMWFDALVFDAVPLRALVELVGADRIVMGTDHPFMPGHPLAYLDSVDPALVTAIRDTNPRHLLALLSGVG